ncbi:GAF domain-containing protein [Paenibacillus sp. GD4]|uniref:GAF domain-containing protein n=1 Tax=Paenibacillus sp. GD4 TaxID=3068890 RepID=UPI0027969FDA|nr:GAF domain-containing protein [Paenibacillus sp. GD4]MDQ1909901.1 GAF domain-containing protein [Paenibacillus sp. GD4]
MPQLKHQVTEELESLCRDTCSDFSAISLVQEHETRIRWRYAYGNRNDRYKHMTLKPGVGPGGVALRTGKPASWSVPLPTDCPLMTAEQLHAATAIPLVRGDQIYGVLLIARRSSGKYGESELTVMSRYMDRIQSILVGTP